MKAVVMAASVASAVAFAPAPVSQGALSSRVAPRSSSSQVTMSATFSKALPFLVRPTDLPSGVPGDFGFDPLGFSNNLDQSYMQTSELKHCRVAMLAVVGFVVEKFVHLPAEQFSGGPLEALLKVPLAGHLQILALTGWFEATSVPRVYGGETSDPWEALTQDPNGAKGFFAKSKAEQDELKLKEIKNGRLAMLAIIGLLAQSLIPGASTAPF